MSISLKQAAYVKLIQLCFQDKSQEKQSSSSLPRVYCMSISCLSVPLVPGNVPLPVHQEMDILNALIVGVVQSLWQVLLQVRFEVLVCFLTLQENNTSRELTDTSISCFFLCIIFFFYNTAHAFLSPHSLHGPILS